MHLVLTDVLVCPRCGPPAGLIVMADRMAGRRVLAGVLGCPNCHENFPVQEGVADLRLEAPGPAIAAAPYQGDPLRLAALTGLMEARGFSLVIGPAGQLAGPMVALVPNLQLVVVSQPGWAEAAEGVSPLLVDGGLPLSSASMRAVIVSGAASESLLRECARVVAGGARVVIDGGSAGVELVVRSGLQVLVAEGGTIVATRAM